MAGGFEVNPKPLNPEPVNGYLFPEFVFSNCYEIVKLIQPLPMNLSQNKLALDIRVPARRINEIVHGKRRITADTALRLAKYFKMSPQFWLGLQMDYDLDVAEDHLADRIENEVQEYQSTV